MIAGFIARRAATTLLTLVLVSVLIFVSTEVLPGDPATAVLGQDATPATVSALRDRLDLDRPATVRYAEWLGGVVRGDLGTSITRGQAVSELVGDRLRNSLLLAGLAVAIGLPVAFALGMLAALRRDRLADHLISTTSLVVMALPEFVVGSLLILVFAVGLGLFPAVTTAPPDAGVSELLPDLWLPALTLAVGWNAYVLRTLRSSLVDALASPHVRQARLAGLPSRWVLLRHALPVALTPAVTATALSVGSLIGGVVVVEVVFNYPGIGTLMVRAVQDRDLPLVQAVALLGAVTWAAVNLAADATNLAVDPRSRTQA